MLGSRIAGLAALLACVLLAPLAPARAAGLAAVQGDLAHELALAGAGSSGYVYDLTAHQVLFSQRASVMRPPASVEKLYTATAALELMGPGARLHTSVLGTGTLDPAGVWQGNLYLRGGGDPTFGSSAFIRFRYRGLGASVSSLAARLRALGIREVAGSIDGDESYLSALRGEPSSGYAPDPFLEGTLSALAFDRGFSGSERGAHAPAAYAARQLAQALRAQGVRVDGSSGAAPTPAGALLLTDVSSPTLAQLLGLTLPPSDNFFAETLLRDLGARFGTGGSTSAGAAVVRHTLASLLELHPRILDGSGLSGSDRTSVYEVVTLLVALAPTSLGTVLREDLAVAGRTGTLARRMRHTGAAGRCEAKTGTLTGVSNLAGYCRTAGAHEIAFAFFDDGLAPESAHTLQDHMVITLAGY